MTDHDCTLIQQNMGNTVWALCSCGWQSQPYESRKDAEAAHDMHTAMEEPDEQEGTP